MSKLFVVSCLVVGFAREALSVRQDITVSADVVQVQVQSRGDYCCCKKNKCRKGAVGEDRTTPAVYSPNHNLCCKKKTWQCKNIFTDWGYRIQAPNMSFCEPGKSINPRYKAPELDEKQVLTAEDLKPGTPEHTVHTYCDLSKEEAPGSAEEAVDDAANKGPALANVKRNKIIGELVKELSKNSLDSMAKEIFSLYICIRWAPSDEFQSLATGEITTGQLPNGSSPLDLFSSFRFVPLRCSRNVNVYEEGNNVNETHFKTFEETLDSIAEWFGVESDGALQSRMLAVQTSKGEDLAQETQAFDLPSVQAAVAKCASKASNPEEMYVDTFKSPAKKLLQDCAAAKWWLQKLSDWHAAMPFVSFMSPSAEAAKKAAPKKRQQVLVCFGKRVASQLHRRNNGDHLLTDQSAVGCHGFWDLQESKTMLKRTIQLWRPPTCQLAAMELDMKMKIMDLIADMNSRLFDALPAMLMEEMDNTNKDGDAQALQAGGAIGMIGGVMRSIVGAFSSMKGTYVRLGELLSNTVVKWAVCPLNKATIPTDVEADKLDGVLGTEDDLARYYAQQAYKKWTGAKNLLPGEKCENDGEALSKLPDTSKCTMCSLGIMQENMPEPYHGEEFICPVRPLLPAKQQLEVLKKKKNLCFMHMTLPQWSEREWMYRGRQPHRKQYNKTENVPTADYEIVKMTGMKSRTDTTFGFWQDFVTVGRRCTELERATTPRWCETPEVANDPSIINGIGSVASDAMALGGGVVDAVKGGLEMAGIKDESPPSNKAYGDRLSNWFYGVRKGVELGLKDAWATNFGAASKRYEKLYNRSFTEVEAGELLHSASFQKELAETGADSKGRQKFDRYAVMCPCDKFDPNREFRLKYKWSEHAFRLAVKAQKKFKPDFFDQAAFTVQLQAAKILFMKDTANAHLESSAHIRVAGVGKGWPAWWKTNDPFLHSLVGIWHTSRDTKTSETNLFGFSATFTCGTRVDMHGLARTPIMQDFVGKKSFRQCVNEGIASNKKIREANPTELFNGQETVVRVTFAPMDDCYSQAFTNDADVPATIPTTGPNQTEKRYFYEHENFMYKVFKKAGSHCSAFDKTNIDLPAYLKNVQQRDNYRGVLVAKGLPEETLLEVLLDPDDVASELKKL